ncbi:MULTISPECIES: glycosyltransferase family 4 protein [Cyanophyceae]|uniref:Glycosyl transferase group 1 n=1 Tax=Chroococcidiopsis thermalis (strain PCC 7203) TaxID=251229 RepID=K9U6E6_CHRTP|nr:glycosyl transferase group 1 [Chroococcidiopsis thermalis PCC 7203]PSB47982.1 glycosyl transferase [Cyanosarcina cf. burmensis CCALA 770]
MIKVFIVCSGLGHVKRGFESFAQECFITLSKESELDVTLFKGGGTSQEKEISLWNLPRNTWANLQIGKLIGRDSYHIEQISFFLSLIPYLISQQPDVIYFSDGNLGNLLWHWRRLTKQKYKLLFSNGGPISPPFSRWDRVQQVAPIHLQVALNAGTPAEKQSLVPYGIHINYEFQALTFSERKSLRCKLGLPENCPLLLSVGAINKTHKRMDYVIREVASLPEPRPYLLLLGQQDTESAAIVKLGNELLGVDNFQIRTVVHYEIADYYKIADAFVLASLSEGLPRVLLEACSYGLPCLAHDYEITQYVIGQEGYLANFELAGSLASLISKVLIREQDESDRQFIHRSAYDRFSWERLRPNYVDMIQRCVESTDPVRAIAHANFSLKN